MVIVSVSQTVPRVMILQGQQGPALALRDFVERSGYAAVGPFTSNAEARLSLQDALPAAAILDVELDDGPTHALAIGLQRAGVAIIYQCDWDEISKVPLEVSDAAFLERDADVAIVSRVLSDLPLA